MTDTIEEIRRKVVEQQKERLTPEERADYILSSKNAKEIIKGLINDKYCFSDINSMIYLITLDNNLNDKEKLGSIAGLSCPFVNE